MKTANIIKGLLQVKACFIEEKDCKQGLCRIIYRRRTYHKGFKYQDFMGSLDLFRLRYAIYHANADPASESTYFWWKTDFHYEDRIKQSQALLVNDAPEYDYDNRLLFINWMIETYWSRLSRLEKLWYSKLKP